jgi:hypothetical protein
VRLLGQDTIAERCRDVGARFAPLVRSEAWDAIEDPGNPEAEAKFLIDELCFCSTIAEDLAQELGREPAEAVLVTTCCSQQ